MPHSIHVGMKICYSALLLILLALPQYIGALTGRTCTVKKSRSQRYTAYQSAKRSARYTTCCKFLCAWRCTRYRDYYAQESVARVRTVYYADTLCCPGWRVDESGTNCGIHSSYPTVVSCPKSKDVRGTSKRSLITWDKPVFREPFAYGLKVTSTYAGESAELPWGATTVTYVATSVNNNKQVRCVFTVTVLPPNPKAVIIGYSRGGSVPVDEHQRLVLECRAEYGKPPPALDWFRNGIMISAGTSYRTTSSDYLDYRHASNALTFNPTRVDNGVDYECKTTPDVTKYSVTLDVAYEVIPLVTYCPANISRESSSRQTLVTWSQPTFVDPRYNETVDVVGNIGPVTQKNFGWGDHRVSYTGTNRRNRLTVTCHFTITIRPPECNTSDLVSVNGAVVCASWPAYHSRLCKPFCSRDYDVLWLTRYPNLYVCDVTGRWRPTPSSLNCSEPRTDVDSFFLPSRDHYFSDSCTVSRDDLKSSFVQTVRRSPYKGVCDDSGCENSLLVTVICS